MFWNGMLVDNKTSLVCVLWTGNARGIGSLILQQYVTDIPGDNLLYAGFIGNELILMRDNVCNHVSISVILPTRD